ncbi:MAG TPA: DUF4139 domain-containing protein [Minicystis sp.]|nr:DUF4139 domain-containing protein [Minicystis sp.]
MKRSLFVLAPLAVAAIGCASQSSFVHSDAALGRIVVYRNGVAYFERTAKVDGENLRLAVPADKVDDFLKSLTVVDKRSGKPAPVSFPTQAPSGHDGLIDMNIGLGSKGAHELLLSYVTEAPSWKPSYRVVLEKGGKLALQAWAIVDNTSGEDWNDVVLGVGSSSALSFRFDLRSIRMVQRETLQSDGLFALAPPTGGASVALAGAKRRVVAELTGDVPAQAGEIAVASAGPHAVTTPPPQAQSELRARSPHRGAKPATRDASGGGEAAKKPVDAPLDRAARAIRAARGSFVVEGYADARDGDKQAASLERASRAREELVRQGVDPQKVVAVGRGEQPGHAAGVAVLEADDAKSDHERPPALRALPAAAEPIGSSHFESKSRMSVARGTSAMVSILTAETRGEVVYYFDPESPRGNATFPFRAVRLVNPTDSVLESGPVTVFGDGKFVGEGLAEPIPARSTAFVPFSLDRQIVVERKGDERDRIARILAVQRGVFSTEVQHSRRTTYVLHNRLDERATVYVRHTVPEGYKLEQPAAAERLGSAYLLQVVVAPLGTAEVTIEEATPVYRTADLRSPGGMELVRAYLSSAALEGPLAAKVDELVRLQQSMGDLEQRIQSKREGMSEYRARMDELHAQVVTLRAVRTAGPLVQDLEKKLADVSDRLSKSTVELVNLEEKLTVSRIRFQDAVAELSLARPASGAAPPEKAARRD